MKIIDVIQGSDEWHSARLGIPTASAFDNIITPTGKPSASADKYKAGLLAEWYTGCPAESVTSAFMDRGKSMEHDAIKFYEFATSAKVTRCGLCVTDDGMIGASPDGLVGDVGLVEIKCLSADNHILNIIGTDTSKKHWCQVQGQMFVTGRAWCDLVFYHPTIESIIRRVPRDDEFIVLLSSALSVFAADLIKWRGKLSRGERPEFVPDSVPF